MAIKHVPAAKPARSPVVARAVAFGCCAWGVIGGVAGTIEWPVVATFFGALAGAFGGAILGTVSGLALAEVARRQWPAWGGTRGCGRQLVAVCRGRRRTGSAIRVAALSGRASRHSHTVSRAWRGVWPADCVRKRGHPLWCRRRCLAATARACSTVGRTRRFDRRRCRRFGNRHLDYPATTLFAVVEGTVLGCVSGIVLALLLAAAVISTKAAAHR